MAVEPIDLEPVRLAAIEYTDRVLAYPNVTGCGVGQRTKKGKRTGEPALVVFVDRKLPVEALRADEVIPRAIETAQGTVLIDVVERRTARFLIDSKVYRPLRGGCEIAAAGSGGFLGTLGAVMYDRTDAELVLLTNNHVLTAPGQRSVIPPNTRVSQPTSGSSVGDTKRIVPWFRTPLGDFEAAWQARVDAGIVALDPAVDAQFRVISLGKHPYVPLPPYEGLEVSKRGRTTELTTGTVTYIDVTRILNDNGVRVRMGGVGSGFEIQSAADSPFSLPGDSGSLVVDAEGGAARGLLFGGDGMNGGFAYACQLSAVMEELQLETPCTGSLNAMFMRALRRRLILSRIGDVGTPFADALAKNLTRFRVKYLKGAADRTVAGALEHLFQDLAHELSESLALDDDFAGLMDLALGDWLVQPTVFDMLEYPLPEDFGDKLGQAFDRLRALCPEAKGYEWVAPAFKGCAGIKMREVLTRSTRHTRPTRKQ